MKKHEHVGVYALIIKNDSVLLIKKARGPYTGQWDLPGGKLEFGEEPLDGLYREIQEETGLIAKDSQLVNVLSHTVTYKSKDGEEAEMYHLGAIYKVELNETKRKLKTEPDNADSNGARWLKLSDINQASLSPFAKASIKNYL